MHFAANQILEIACDGSNKCKRILLNLWQSTHQMFQSAGFNPCDFLSCYQKPISPEESLSAKHLQFGS